VFKLLKNIKFTNYKTHKKFSVNLNSFNILVGPNNSGKSTIIEALRILGGAYRYASRFKPKTLLNASEKIVSGYHIPETSIPISIRHVHTDYNELLTKIEYVFKGKKSLIIEFQNTKDPILYFEGEDKPIRSTTSFRNEFPLNLSIVPTLGTLEEDEERHDFDYVKRWSSSHRAPRLFRNVWYYDMSDFDKFKQILEETWKGVTIQPPEMESNLSKTINMFCTENRMDREIFWAGNGFQIWLQLLTHIIKNKNASLLVIDEPEIYLHPDLQRKLVSILRDLRVSVFIATHSVEIINEVEPDEVLILEKGKKNAKRLTDLIGLQNAVGILGSTQNVQLTRLARGKKVLFVEGKDSKFLERFAKILGYYSLFSSGELTVIPVGGFSQWEKISHAQWAFSGVLGEEIKVAALFDRDYRNNEQVETFRGKLKDKVSYIHVLEKKEIENYLLIPEAIEKSIKTQLSKRINNGNSQFKTMPQFNIEEILFEITDSQKSYVLGQLVDQEFNHLKSKGYSLPTIISEKQPLFEKDWENLSYRLNKVSGKEAFSLINKNLQIKWGISISQSSVLSNIVKNQLDIELQKLFEKLNEFINDKSYSKG
jgi:predicted ATP-dependent endonuclease of OLD family